MRTSPRRISLVAAALAVSCTTALGAVGDLTRFPTPSPGRALPQGGTIGPDGATWFFGTYTSDPGIASSARTRAAGKRPHGTAPCCSRLIRVGLDGGVSSRGASVFGTTGITGLTAFAGDLWALSADSSGSAPYRATRYPLGGSATSYPMTAVGFSPVTGPDGNLWYWASGYIGRLAPSGAALSAIPMSVPTVLASGDGAAWTATTAPALRRIAPDGSTTDTPTPSTPGSIATSSDGFVWYSDAGSHAIGRRAPDGTVVEAVDVSRSPQGMAVSPDGVAWSGDGLSGRLYRVTPSMSVEALSIPDAFSVGPPTLGSDGNIWFAYAVLSGDHYFGRVLTGVIPVVTGSPVASGQVAVGQALTTTDGRWRYAPTGHGYQWQRCDGDNPTTCADIGGATGPTHTVTASDLGKGIRVRVSATNLNGSAGPVASNILTAASPPSSSITVRKPTRRGYVISTIVGVPGPGTIRQVGTVTARAVKSELALARRPAPKPIRACAPKPIAVTVTATRTVRCVLSPRVRTLLASRKLTVTLRTTFTDRAGGQTTVTRRVTVPRIPRRR